MFSFRYLLTFLLISTFSSAERFTLATAVPYALAHNPELAAARFSIAEARGRLLQAGRRANPELESELRPNVRGREFSFDVGFVQKFPLTNRLRLEQAVSAAGVQVAEAEVRAAELKLSVAVRVVGVKMLSLQSTKALKEKQIANSQELAASAAKLAGRGEGSSLEATQFELEAQQLALELLQLEMVRATLVGEARPLLGTGSAEVEFTGNLRELTEASAGTLEVAGRPDYQAAQARLEAARQAVALAKANRWEDASVGLSAGVDRNEDAPQGLQTDGIVGIKFSLPLPFWNKNEGKIQEAEATAARTEKEAEALVAALRAEVAAALGEMTAARRILNELHQNLLPKATELEAKIAAAHKQGQPGTQLSDVLRAREKRLAIEQAQLDALRTYHLARIRHAAALGH